MSKIQILEEFQKNNFLGDIVGELMKQLRAFEEKKAKERQKLVEEGSDELLQKFDQALDKVIKPKKELIAKLKFVYDYYHGIEYGSAVELRRQIKGFTDMMKENVLIKGEMPSELMAMQKTMIKERLDQFETINQESKEFSDITGVKI